MKSGVLRLGLQDWIHPAWGSPTESNQVPRIDAVLNGASKSNGSSCTNYPANPIPRCFVAWYLVYETGREAWKWFSKSPNSSPDNQMIPMDTPNLIVSSERGGPDNGSRNLLLCWTGGMIDECLLPGIFERMSVSRSATNRLFAVLYERSGRVSVRYPPPPPIDTN